MSEVKPELKYTKDHEWIKLDGEIATIGITDYAQGSLGDLVYVELPAVGKKVTKGEACAVVESCKSASDVYAPVTGEVVEVNSAATQNPEKINQAAYDTWMFKIKLPNTAEISELLDANKYQELVA